MAATHPRTLPESTSGSGSFQSHLSTTNSQQRLRATGGSAPSTKESSSLTSPVISSPNNLTNTLRAFLFPEIPISIHFQDHHASSRSWKYLALKWMALVYCFLSVIFTSTALYKYLYLRTAARMRNEIVPSSFEFLSAEQRLSRISSYLGGDSQMFEPYIILPASPPAGITACLWTNDDGDAGFRLLVSWASQWPGPISLVMTTETQPHSIQHQQLIQRIKPLRDHPSLSSLSLHLIHTTHNGHSPSAYLNLARLYANSRTVMLFPANISNLLPSNFYSALASRLHLPIRKPLLVTSLVTSAFSIPDLTPVVLPRNYPVWCTERGFLASRTSDWEDCLWQLWLEEYGLGHANITVAIDTEDSANPASDLTAPLRNRLSEKYRAETCEVAMRRLWADTPRISKTAKRKLQWVKNFCRQTENSAKNSGA
ncbi:hypothetical protein B0H16DRAFT_1710078 [Mycena metata]|uniref:Uncharacterized protein n=1 Tax=Mycena metata TaxID=1033252 RepID=A0AAD7P0Z5_9AGAR|nr:hypothetical protein B0H16DRAFT_1710078 [Mycena metata]